ncbi:MAG: UPF0234 protein [Candidatus Binatia bacterium]|nr:MAG: UPF0234 protein [Candidatus Binatia bacterium]
MPSFDVVSEVDLQEVQNALQQARKEIEQRYDFKNTNTTLELEDDTITITSSDEYKVRAAYDVLQSKLVRRKVPLRAILPGKVEPAAGGRTRQSFTIQRGIDAEKARSVTKAVKETKLKVQVQIQGDQLRISGKKKDDLQAVIRLLREKDFGIPLQFTNFRD